MDFSLHPLDVFNCGKYDGVKFHEWDIRLKKDILTVDPEILRQAMRHWATGVTIVSSRYGELRHGMTVSSFTSVSVDPPLVLVSLQWGTRTNELIRQSGIFGITLLEHTQQEISDRFAGRISEYLDRFEGLDTFDLKTGAPLLVGGLAYLDCRVVLTYEVGGHSLVIGEVLAVKEGLTEQPLIYYNRNYRMLS